MNLFRRFRDVVVAALLLALPFFFLNANLKAPDRLHAVDRLALRLSAPVQYAARVLADTVSSWAQEYMYLVEVKRENHRLQRRVEQLSVKVESLQAQAWENQRLQRLLELRARAAGPTLSAWVIGKEISPFFRVIRLRLDVGDQDQVRVGMPVVSPAGLVGQIRRTWGRYSDVLLTVDKNSAIDVVVQRTGARGMLRGTGESDRYACRIQYLVRTDDVQVGDRIYTSGFGQRFAPNLLVGTVSKVTRKEFGLYQEVEAEPAVNFSGLQEALVLLEGPPDTSRQEASRRE